VLSETGYLEALEAERTIEARGRIENLQELVEVAREYDATSGGQDGGLEDFLSQISLVADADTRRDDEGMVTLMTLHNAKGLEYPVVAAPFLWSAGRTWEGVPVFHDPQHGDERTVDAGGKGNWEEFDDHHDRAIEEKQGEDLRLLYVALTRARHQALLWFAPASNSDRSPLAKVLFGLRDRDGRVDTTGIGRVTSDDRLNGKLRALAGSAGGRIAIEAVPRMPSDERWTGREDDAAELVTATFDRELDRAWRRTSYSRLTARHDGAPRVGSEPEEPVKDDEGLAEGVAALHGPRPAETPTLDEAALRDVRLPLAGMPGGTEIGTFIHSVLEHTDFAARPLSDEIVRTLEEQGRRRRVDVGDRAAVVEGLELALTTDLGDLTDGCALADLGQTQRLDELGFEFPVDVHGAGGLHVADIGRLLDAHLDRADPLAGYAQRLQDPLFEVDVRGYLNGSIDLVLRVDGPDGQPRFVVADHKTNRLAPFGEDLTAWHYRPEAMAEAMIRGHYPLQALLYTVAVHRYLRWRLRGPKGRPIYDPRRHLGGVAYLFLRGMVGVTHRGQPCGVFAWRPPAALIVELSDLLDHGRIAA
ncbi:MAG: AAA family ATPase, partial [Actinobacteria bacterium]|nr:AAA family ATPase [Actinomycetota bacterium]